MPHPAHLRERLLQTLRLLGALLFSALVMAVLNALLGEPASYRPASSPAPRMIEPIQAPAVPASTPRYES